MPTLDWNKRTWDGSYDWSSEGTEWSAAWGNAEAQWFGALYPRVHAHLPAGVALEIAPGFGRWTQFLQRLTAEKLFLVDISDDCINHCRARFRNESHISFHVNDGTSLEMIPDRTLDFVFSFDSLVHVEAEVIDAYLGQLAKKMKPNAVGFIHHSNLRPYVRYFRLLKSVRPGWIREKLLKQRLDIWDHHRDPSMSAALFEQMCRKHGLLCTSQELINWGGPFPIDALTTFTPLGSQHSRTNRILKNLQFMAEASYIARLAPLYARGATPTKEKQAPTE